MRKTTTHKGIEITVLNDGRGRGWEAYFTNAPGFFEQLGNNAPALRGFKTEEEALQAGEKFVDDHQWQYICQMGIFEIHIRLWWNGKWGYGIRAGSSENSASVYKSSDEAIGKAKIRAQEKIAELEEAITKLK